MNNHKTVYLSTPIYYVNGNPHLGHAYSTLMVDFIANFYRFQGHEVVFITGADQHGQKIYQSAINHKITPAEFIKQKTQVFKNLWKRLNINYDYFVETTHISHQKFIQNQFQQFLNNGFLKLHQYSGWYCVSCETFIKLQLNQKPKCDLCQNDLIHSQELNYFFHVRNSQKTWLKQQIPHWTKTTPKIKYFHDLNSFLQLENWDFSISRQNLKWGIPLLDHHQQTAYVWFDALFSYISVLPPLIRNKIWKLDSQALIIQVLGKEISKFHLIYWPLLLKSANFRLPDQFLIHGWLLNQSAKMSKSKNNALAVEPLLAKYSSEIVRFYLATLMYPGQDIDIKSHNIDQFYQSQLVNNLSNYCHRVLKMIEQSNWKLPYDFEPKLTSKTQTFYLTFQSLFKTFKIAKAINVFFDYLIFANKYLDSNQPWKLIGKEDFKLNHILAEALLFIANIPAFIAPIVPQLSQRINTWFQQSNFDFSWQKQKINRFKIVDNTVLYQKK